MAILPGRRLGPYEILSAIGAGGMGEVYKAHDTKLARDVAIKVLPANFVNEPQRLSRFQREARMLAALNHPNIATIYGLEQSDGVTCLVMELVPGATLAERVKAGPLPVEEALRIALQIAEALEAAHEKSIIHRDLKPANIKVTPEGKVKVLDFGLAKAFGDDSTNEDMNNSPTLSRAATMQGVILGTAAYMSPEQARGRTVDKCTDTWAFGCVLYELVTGKQAFNGEDITEILASVMKSEPDWTALPAKIPTSIRTLLTRCLRKDRRQRLADAGAVRIEIEEALTAPASAVAPNAGWSTTGWRERAAWLAGLGLLALTTVAFAIGFVLRAPKPTEAIRFFVSPPDTWSLMGAGTLTTGPVSVSPDGRRIVMLATSADGKSILWVRSLDTLTAQALAGTEGALRPFWSPDSRFVGFFSGGKLKKIEIAGGPPITLCDAPEGFGGTWNREGVIVFAPTATSALQRVSAAGGAASEVTRLDQGESGHRMPFFLPDGRHFFYRSAVRNLQGGLIYLASLASSERKLVLNADSSNVFYTQGHLLFLRETTLMAQPFDPRRLVLTGEAFPIAEQIQTQGNPLAGVFSASENGVLAYQTGAAMDGYALTWFDRSGKKIGILGEPAIYSDVELSPDGKRASVGIPEPGKGRNIWIYDVARSLKTRFTFDAAIEAQSVWSPDGSRVVFSSNRKGHYDLYQNASDGSGTEVPLLEDNLDKYPESWSADGRFILYGSTGGPTGNDLFVLPLTGDRKPVPFLNTQFNEFFGRFSPDGRWVAYRSNESGKFEIYVAPFPGPGGKRQISTSGGGFPRWRHDGTEIFYLAPDNKLMVAAVNGKGPSFEVGAVKPLFDTRVFTGLRYPYDVTADGQRFLVNTVPGQASSAPVTVIVNWTAGLKK